jgi:DNA-directed RNA polymerase alpha subunit
MIANVAVDGGTVKATLQPGRTETDANDLRRALLRETTALSATVHEIEENTSGFADEIIAHRISLLPLRNNITVGDTLTVNARGPRVVLAKDLLSEDGASSVPAEAHNIMLALLAKDECVSLAATVEAGSGKDDARFNHVVAARVVGGGGEAVGVAFETLSSADSVDDLLREAVSAVDRASLVDV